MGQLIDSNVLMALERRGETLFDLMERLGVEPVAISVITASVLLVGAYRARSTDQRLHRETFLEVVYREIPVLPVDLTVARVYAQLWAQLASSGQLIGAHDLLIAATAVAHGYAVLTDNVRDFGRVLGLEVRQPGW